MSSKEQLNEPKEKPKDLNDVEMVFGSPNPTTKTVIPDVHVITNERRHVREPSTVITRGPDSDVEAVPTQTQPLLEPDRGRQKPPLAGPEVDDLEDDDKDPPPSAPYPGVDDGLLEPGKPEVPGEEADHDRKEPNGHPKTAEDGGSDDGNWWHGVDQPDYPYDPTLMNRFGPDDRPGSPMIPGSIIPDVNTYQQKKNLAQGMMDLALLSANANQLRYVLESSDKHPYFYPSLVFISLSILFQIAVGVGLIMNSRYDVKDDKDMCRADKINNMTVLGIFLITIVNVFITSFSVATPNVAA